MGSSLLPVSVNTNEGTSNNLGLSETLSAFFSIEVPVENLFLIVAYLGKIKYHRLTIESWCSIIFLICQTLSFCIHVIVPCTILHRIQPMSTSRLSILAYFSTSLRMLAAAAILLFLDTVHAVVVLPLLLLVLVVLAFFCWQTFTKNVLGMNWGIYKTELKLEFELSSQVVSMAYAAMSGTVLGYVKDSPNLTGGGGYMAPECFLFYGVILGLLMVLLSTVPTRIDHRRIRRRMAKVYMRILSYAALLFLVLAGIMAVQEILQEYVFCVCFVIFVIAVLYQYLDNLSEKKRGETEKRQETAPSTSDSTGITALTSPRSSELHPPTSVIRTARIPGAPENTVRELDSKYTQYLLLSFRWSFIVLMATYSSYGIRSGSTVGMSWWSKVFVLSALCSILNYAVRMVIFAEMADAESLTLPKTSWTISTSLTLATTLICFFLVVFLHPDEVKNIL